MGTKDKILATALQLLNEKGVKSVTIRDVAAEMGISHGNLGYHYANIDKIIFALYQALVEKMDATIAAIQVPEIHFRLIVSGAQQTFLLFYEYRFLFIDFVTIGRSIPKLKKHYIALQQQREIAFFEVIQLLQQKDIVSKRFSTVQYKQLIQSLTVFGDFWISSSELGYSGKKSNKIDHYLGLFLSLIYPYLTKKGVKQYDYIMQELHK